MGSITSSDSPFTLTIDWLAFTLPDASTEDVFAVVGGEWTKTETGFRGYPLSWILADGGEGVGKMGTGALRRLREVHTDLSGGIVSSWEIEKVRTLLRWIVEQKGHVTRIDCALDDRRALVPLARIKEAVQAGQVVTRAHDLEERGKSSLRSGETKGATLYFGSPTSQTRLRIYDKRLELQHKGRENWPEYGVRWELELKKERAHACAEALGVLEHEMWQEFIVSFLRSYIDFRETTREEDTWERCQAPLVDWWETLTQGFRKGRLTIEQAERTIEEVKAWVVRSVAPTLSALRDAPEAGPVWLDRTIEAGRMRRREKHRRLLRGQKPKQSYVLKPP